MPLTINEMAQKVEATLELRSLQNAGVALAAFLSGSFDLFVLPIGTLDSFHRLNPRQNRSCLMPDVAIW